MEEDWDRRDTKTPNRDNLPARFQESKNLIKVKPYIAIAILRIRGNTTPLDPPPWTTATCKCGQPWTTTHAITNCIHTQIQRITCPGRSLDTFFFKTDIESLSQMTRFVTTTGVGLVAVPWSMAPEQLDGNQEEDLGEVMEVIERLTTSKGPGNRPLKYIS